MKFHSILALGADSELVAGELVEQAGDFKADLAVLFTSHHHGPEFGELLGRLHDGLNVRNLIGCTGESIIGPDREIEGQPAVVLWLASLPGVRVLPFLIDQEDLQSFENVQALEDRVGASASEQPSFVILAEPHTFDIHTAILCMDQAYPARPKVGGMASGGSQAGENRLFLNDQELRQGLVGVALSGPVRIETVVSQGCRPIGKPLTVTQAQRNVIEELDGSKPYEVLKKTYMEAPAEEQELMQQGLHVGVVVDQKLTAFRPGDFLIHNLLGVQEQSNLVIGGLIRRGQTIQFHVRDATTADAEMRALLASKSDQIAPSTGGGLLFNCNGRGRHMFEQPNHDIALVNRAFASCQVAGFFAQGEIGPVGGRSFVHGFTSSLILFQEA